MLSLIAQETGLDPQEIHKRSNTILDYVLHNYGGFEISTIDSFVHRIIRTFARDLKLPNNFEVELDQERMLHEAVDHLISKAGIDQELTKVLVDFAIEKSDEDKSFDVSYDLKIISKLLVTENDLPFVKLFKSKSIGDFLDLRADLFKRRATLKQALKTEATQFFKTLQDQDIESRDFKGRYHLPYFYNKILSEELDLNVGASWQQAMLDGQPLYAKGLAEAKKPVLDRLQEAFIQGFNRAKDLLQEFHLINALYKNIVPLSALKGIQESLETLKEDEGKLLISEFNTIINQQIKDQPTPFIYERLGEKFQHHFIDEFQDTSSMQWTNLIPLIAEALASENASATIVGDAKQAIYRWRGGDSEQFVNLVLEKSNPFNLPVNKQKLEDNYRSSKTIVAFNNAFFDFVGLSVFENPDYASLYDAAKQGIISDKEGYIRLQFFDMDKVEGPDQIYPAAVYQQISNCLSRGYRYSDLCVLVRRRKEGVLVGSYLGEQQIPISTSETLLLQNSLKIQFLVAFLKHLNQPDDQTIKFEMLYLMCELQSVPDKDAFIKDQLSNDLESILNTYYEGEEFKSLLLIPQLPLYELIEHFIRRFRLADPSDAYIQFFLDMVFEQSQKGLTDLSSLLAYYDTHKDRLSIVAPADQDAVKIMTIHQSKGLEFPVVIFPYADLKLNDDRRSQLWYPVNPDAFNGFEALLINASKKMETFSKPAKELYAHHQSQLILDHINLLYVTLTRPKYELHILSKKDLDKSGNSNLNSFSGLFISYLKHVGLWRDTQDIYEIGSALQAESKNRETTSPALRFISVPKEAHQLKILSNSKYLWNPLRAEAIEKGNLVHQIMSQITVKDDVEFALSDAQDAGLINAVQYPQIAQEVWNIIRHPELSKFFEPSFTVYNEQDILSPDGTTHRPDRICIDHENNAHLIDYKSGTHRPEHRAQLNQYSNVLDLMGYQTVSKLLVYVNESVEVIAQ